MDMLFKVQLGIMKSDLSKIRVFKGAYFYNTGDTVINLL